MDTIFSSSNGRNATRRMYQATPFGTPPLGRQADPLRGSYVGSSQHSSSCSGSSSWVLWRDEPSSLYQDPRVRRGRICSALLAVAVFLVVLTVLSIAGLAVYMGALRIDTNKPELVFDGSVRVISGDNFVPSLGNNSSTTFKETALKYQNMVDKVYKRSQLRPAYKKCVIQKFENGSLIVFFRLYLDRRKIPRNFQNVEETARDILVNELIAPRTTAFKNIQIDATSIFIKRSLDDTVMSPAEETAKKKPPGNRTLQIHNGVLRKAMTEDTSILNKTHEFPMVLKQENSGMQETNTEDLMSKTQEMEGEAIPIIEGTVAITKIKETAMDKHSDVPQTLKDWSNVTISNAEGSVKENKRDNYTVSKAAGNSVPESIRDDTDRSTEGSSKHVLNSTVWTATISEIDFPGGKVQMKSETEAKLTTDSSTDTKYSNENADSDPIQQKTQSPHISNKKQSIQNAETFHFEVETITKFSAKDGIRQDFTGIKQDNQDQKFERPNGKVTDSYGKISHNANGTLMKRIGEKDVLLMGSPGDFTENPLTFKTNTYNDRYQTQATPGLNPNFWNIVSRSTQVPTSLNVPGTKSNYTDTELTGQHFKETFLHTINPPHDQTEEPWRPVLPYFTKNSPKPDDADIGTGVAEVVVVPPSATENQKANGDQYNDNQYSSRVGQPAASHGLPESLSGGYGSFSLHPNLQESWPNDTISRVSLHVISPGGISGENLETNILHTTSGGGIIIRRQHHPLMSATFSTPHTIPLTYTTPKPPTTHRPVANPFTIPDLPILHQFHDVDAILKAAPPAKNTESSVTLQRHQSESLQGDFTVNRKWMGNSSNGHNNDPRNPNLGTGSVSSDKQQWIKLFNDTNVKLQHSSHTEAFPTRYQQQAVWDEMGNKERTENSKIPFKGTDIPSVGTSVESSLSRTHVNKSTRVQLATHNPLGDSVANTPFSIVTLIPVRSNSGIGKPLRPRPKLPSHIVVQIKNDTEPVDVVLISEYSLKKKADHGLSSSLLRPMESDVVNGIQKADISLKREGNIAGSNERTEEFMISFNQSSTETPQHKAGSTALDQKSQSSDKYSTQLPILTGIISSLSQQMSSLSSPSPIRLSKIPPTLGTILTPFNKTQTQPPTKTVTLLPATRPTTLSSIQQPTSERLTQYMQQLTSEKLTSFIQLLTPEVFTTLSPKPGTSLAASSTVSLLNTSSSSTSIQELTSQKLTTLPPKKETSSATLSTLSPLTTSSSIQLTAQKLTKLPPTKGTSSAILSTLSPATTSSSIQQTALPPKKGTSSATLSILSSITTSSPKQLTSQKLTTLPLMKATSSAILSTLSPVTTASSIQLTTLTPKKETSSVTLSTLSPITTSSSIQMTLPPKKGTSSVTLSTLSPVKTSSPIQTTSQKLTILPPRKAASSATVSTKSPVTTPPSSSSVQLTTLTPKKGTSPVTLSTLSPIITSSSTQLTSPKLTTRPPKKGISSAASSNLSPMTTPTLQLRKITQPQTVPTTKVIETPTTLTLTSRIKSTQTTTKITLPPSTLLPKATVGVNDSISYKNHESQNNKKVTDKIKNATNTAEGVIFSSISTFQQRPSTELEEGTTAHSTNSNNTKTKETNREYTSQIPSAKQQILITRILPYFTQTSTTAVPKDQRSTMQLSSQSTIIPTTLSNFIPLVVTQDSSDEIWQRNNSYKQTAKVDSTVPALETFLNTSDIHDVIGSQRQDIMKNSTSVIRNSPKTKNNTTLGVPELKHMNVTENGQHQNVSVTISQLQGGNNSTEEKPENVVENVRNKIFPPNVVTPHSVILNTDMVTTTSIEISFRENEGEVIMNSLKSSQASKNIKNMHMHNDQSSIEDLPITKPSAVMEMTSIPKVKETRRQPKMKLTNTYEPSSDKLRLEERMIDSNGNLKSEEKADTDLLMPKADAIIDPTTTPNIVISEDNDRKNITLSAGYEPGNYNYSVTLNIPRTTFIKLNSTTESSVPENYGSEQITSAEEKTISANINVPSSVRTYLTTDRSPHNEELPVNFSFTAAGGPLLERTDDKVIPTEAISSTLYDVLMPKEEIFSTEDEVANSSNDTLEIFTNFTITKVTASSNMQGNPPPGSFELSDDDIMHLLNATRNHSIISQEVVNTLSKFANIHTALSSNNITQDTKINNHDDEDQINHETTENYVGEKITNITATEEAKLSTKAILLHGSNNHAGIPILTKIYNKAPQPSGEKVASTEAASFANVTACPSNQSLHCGDGECISSLSRCNQLVDCSDGVDEQGCSCADYLKAQFLTRKLCDGVVDCWDFSDENNCEWCTPGQFVCPNSQVCVDQHRLCDGARDCPYGDDEKQCVTIAQNEETAGDFPYNSEGYLMVRKQGRWGKLCLQNFENVVARSQSEWEVADLGRAVCKAMTYSDFDRVNRTTDTVGSSRADGSHYFELAYSSDIYSNTSQPRSNLLFQETKCNKKEVVHVSCRDLQCGIRPQAINQWASSRHSRIVGGGNAAPGSWPWQAALYKEGEFQCGATLIADRWLVSAGHCFYHALDDYWVARLGALRRGSSFPSPYEQLRPVSHIILHPGYVDAGFLNDISLLRLRDPVQFSDFVRPVCLPPAPIRDGRLCTVVGWGQLFEVGRIFPDTLQEVQLPVISTAECRKRTLFLPLYRVTDNMFCAGFDRGGRDACLGDSGGPLMCQEKDGHWSLYGVTSNGYGCARANRPGVYTKVANYIPWLQAAMVQQVSSLRDSKTQCKGHRCPLGECLPPTRVCNGFMECSDGSDEKGCW